MLLLVILAACGDAATGTPVPATPALAATTVPTTVAPTTAAPTSTATAIVAATTVAPTSTAVVTTVAAKSFVSEQGAFSVSVPNVPAQSKLPISLLTDNAVRDTYFFEGTLSNSHLNYQITYVDLPKTTVDKLGASGVLNDQRNKFVKSSNANLLSHKAFTLGSIPADASEIRHDNSYIYLRSYVAGNRLFQVITGGTISLKDAPEIKAFLNSFQINVSQLNAKTPPPTDTNVDVASLVTGLSEMKVDTSVAALYSKNLSKYVSDLKVNWYATEDTSDKLATSIDAKLVALGYTPPPVLESNKTLYEQAPVYAGYYVKDNSADLTTIIIPASTNPAELGQQLNFFPSLSVADVKAVAAQLAGKKSFIMVVSGHNLINGLVNATSLSSSTPVNATVSPVAVSTPIARPTFHAVNIPLPNGSKITGLPTDPSVLKKIISSFSGVSNLQMTWYAGQDYARTVAQGLDTTFLKAGAKAGPPDNKLIEHEDGFVGVYTEAGMPDTLILTVSVEIDFAELASPYEISFATLGIPNLGSITVDFSQFPDMLKQQIEHYQSFVLELSGTNLAQAYASFQSQPQTQPTFVAITAGLGPVNTPTPAK